MNTIVPAIYRYLLRFFILGVLFWCNTLIRKYAEDFGSIYPIILSLIQFAVFFTIINLVMAAFIMIYRLRKNIPYKYTDNVILGLNNVYYIIVSFGLIIMVIGFWGINFKELLTSLSIFAAALAIITKDYISTIISGIILSFSNEINIDDYVKIGELKGKIIDINIQKIVLQNDDDDIIYIPNDKVMMSEIINYTKRDIKKVSIDFQVSSKNFESIEVLEQKLTQALSEFLYLIEPHTFNLKVVNVFHEYLDLKFQYNLKEVNREIERQIRKKTVRLIANMIKK